jgi:hypothetical protein
MKKLLLIPFALAISACEIENAEDRQIASAISCMDQAHTQADADVCMAKVDGLNSERAYSVRCSAHFIAQGLTGDRLGQAFQQLQQNPGGGGTQSSALAAYLVFRNLTNHTSDITLNDCTLSGSVGAKGLASMAHVATKIASFSSGGGGGITPGTNLDPASVSFDRTAIVTELTNLKNQVQANNPAATPTVTAIGQAAVAAQQAYCSEGSMAGEDICTRLNNAINAGNASGLGAFAIGSQLINALLGL